MYLSQDFDMAKGEFDMLYLCAGVGVDKSTSLEGSKTTEMIRGGFQKMKGKNKENIMAHPLDKL